jgi:nitrite reductase/ring-hydroxylating ferredoxin subunit
MSFQSKEVGWISARIADNRFITTIEPLEEAQVMEFGIPSWALRKGRLVVRTDNRIYATADVRLHKTANMRWESQDTFPFRVHFAYTDK